MVVKKAEHLVEKWDYRWAALMVMHLVGMKVEQRDSLGCALGAALGCALG